MLQAHIDMVPQANADTQHDFTARSHRCLHRWRMGHRPRYHPGCRQRHGHAGCLAVLADKTIKHGPLEVLLTTDEETGDDRRLRSGSGLA